MTEPVQAASVAPDEHPPWCHAPQDHVGACPEPPTCDAGCGRLIDYYDAYGQWCADHQDQMRNAIPAGYRKAGDERG